MVTSKACNSFERITLEKQLTDRQKEHFDLERFGHEGDLRLTWYTLGLFALLRRKRTSTAEFQTHYTKEISAKRKVLGIFMIDGERVDS